LIADAFAALNENSRQIEEHLRREDEFKQKVLNRENKEVLRLIESFEFIPSIGNAKFKKGLNYSDL